MIVFDVSRLHGKFRKRGKKKKKGNWQEDNEEKAYQCDDHVFCFFFFITIRFTTSMNFTWYGKKYKDIKENKLRDQKRNDEWY